MKDGGLKYNYIYWIICYIFRITVVPEFPTAAPFWLLLVT